MVTFRAWMTDLRANPIYARLTVHQQPMRVLPLLAGLAVGALLVALNQFLLTDLLNRLGGSGTVFFVFRIATFAIPPIFGVIIVLSVAQFTAVNLDHEDLKLLALSPLDERTVRQGFFWAATRRVRFWIAVGVGQLVVGWVTIPSFVRQLVDASPEFEEAPGMRVAALVVFVLVWMVSAFLSNLGNYGLAISSGVGMPFSAKSDTGALARSLGVYLLVIYLARIVMLVLEFITTLVVIGALYSIYGAQLIAVLLRFIVALIYIGLARFLVRSVRLHPAE